MSTSYHVYSNDGLGGPIDYSTPVATVSALTWDTSALAAGVWRFAVRAFDTVSGLEESNVDAVIEITVDASLDDVSAVPAAPVGLAAVATASGGAHVTWGFPDGRTVPTGFRVYIDTPTISYGSPVATVAARVGQVRYTADLTGLSDGSTYQIAVRAHNAVGEETNAVVVSVTGNTAAPANVANLTAS